MAPRKPAMYRAVFLIWMTHFFDFGQCSRQAFFQACRCCHWSSSEEAFTEFQRLGPDAVVSAKGRASHGGASHPPPGRIYGSLVRAPRAKPCLSAALLPVFGGRGCLEPHARETLSLLHKKVPLYGASNGILAIQQARLEKANLTAYFSGLFVSDKIGAEKPDPRFFTFCLQRSGFPAEDVLMVGDSLTADIAGASSVGMDGCWYHPNTAPPPANTILTHAITDLRQLAGPFVWGAPESPPPFLHFFY